MKIKVKEPITNKTITVTTATINRVFSALNLYPLVGTRVSEMFTHHYLIFPPLM